MPGTVWISGLPGAGKTATGRLLRQFFRTDGQDVVRVDGDVWRREVTPFLSYTADCRAQNVTRIAEFARTLNQLGCWCLVDTCSPMRGLREMAREIVGPPFYEVTLQVSVEEARRRVPERYAKADSGEHQNYPGVHLPFEPSPLAELVIDTELKRPAAVAEKIYLEVMSWKTQRAEDIG